MSDSAIMSDLNLSDSVVVIDVDSETELTPSKITPASKRKRDDDLTTEDHKLGMGVKDSNLPSSDNFIDMERMSPEPRRKNPASVTPQKPPPPPDAVPLSKRYPDVLEDTEFDSNLPETVCLLRAPSGSKVYLIGTAHFSLQSQDDVSKVIQAVQPSIVVVELCNSRIDILTLDEETILQSVRDMNMNKVLSILKRLGQVQGLLYLTLLHMSAHATKQLGMAPGGEFRRAWLETRKLSHCAVMLGDRPINVSMARLISALSWWQCGKLIWNLVINKEPIKKEDVEKAKKRDFLEAMLTEMSGEFPSMEEVLVNERDKFLTYSLQNAACAHTHPVNIVGVVGIGHVRGIQKYWNTVTAEEIARISEIPPASLTSRVLRTSVRIVFWGGVAYVAYRIVPAVVNRVAPKLPYEKLTQLFRR